MRNLYLSNLFVKRSGGSTVIIPPAPPSGVGTLLVVFWGESNAGGVASNAEASAHEIAERPAVQKLDEYSLLFENLDIGSNNLQDHFGLTDNATHGFENGLALAVEANLFAPLTQVHLVKTGQGGSTIGQWTTGGSYMNKFEERVTAAKAILDALPLTYTPVVWASQGINDHNASTDPTVWKTALINRLAYIRTFIGGNPYIFFTRLLNSMATYNSALDAMAAADDHLIIIDTPQPPTSLDGFHWGYAQMKTISELMSQYTGLIQDYTNANFVFDGNGLTLGGTGGAVPYPTLLSQKAPLNSNGTDFTNLGVSGQTTQQMIDDAVAQVDALIVADVRNILFAWEIAEDIYVNGDVNAAFTRFKNYCLARRAAGWKVIVLNLTPRSQTTAFGDSPSQFQTKLNNANALLAAQWTDFSDGFVDLLQDASLATLSGTYFPDNIHPSTAGNVKVANLVMKEILNRSL